MKILDIVKFKSKVYKHPYKPYYDKYKGHKFQIVRFHPGNHIELKCITNKSIVVDGYVHDDELLVIKTKKPKVSLSQVFTNERKIKLVIMMWMLHRNKDIVRTKEWADLIEDSRWILSVDNTEFKYWHSKIKEIINQGLYK